MGLTRIFKALFSGAGTAFNRVAKTIKEILENLTAYRLYRKVEYLHKAAWLLKYGVYDSIEKWNWRPTANIYIPDHKELSGYALGGVLMIVHEMIEKEICKISKEQADYIRDIIAGKSAYYEVEHLISLELKNKLRP